MFVLCVDTMTSRINTNVFFDVTDFQAVSAATALCCDDGASVFQLLVDGRNTIM